MSKYCLSSIKITCNKCSEFSRVCARHAFIACYKLFAADVAACAACCLNTCRGARTLLRSPTHSHARTHSLSHSLAYGSLALSGCCCSLDARVALVLVRSSLCSSAAASRGLSLISTIAAFGGVALVLCVRGRFRFIEIVRTIARLLCAPALITPFQTSINQ